MKTTNKYTVFCHNCNFKQIIIPSELKNFVCIKSSMIQKTIPQIDLLTKKLISKETSQPIKVKCPKCGFAVRPKIIPKEKQND